MVKPESDNTHIRSQCDSHAYIGIPELYQDTSSSNKNQPIKMNWLLLMSWQRLAAIIQNAKSFAVAKHIRIKCLKCESNEVKDKFTSSRGVCHFIFLVFFFHSFSLFTLFFFFVNFFFLCRLHYCYQIDNFYYLSAKLVRVHGHVYWFHKYKSLHTNYDCVCVFFFLFSLIKNHLNCHIHLKYG